MQDASGTLDAAVYSEETPGSAKAAMTVSAGSDNGFNSCVPGHYAGSARHSTTTGAIDNLINMVVASLDSRAVEASKGPPHIAGHGDSGFMTTGCGQNGPQNYDNTIGTWNEGSWGPQFDRLQAKNYAILTLLTCTTGAGQEGADLLYAMAKRTGKAVRARTGLTYCGSGGVTYENGSTWQVATPGSKPSPIPPPSQHFAPSHVVQFMTDNTLRAIDVDAITKVSVIRRFRGIGTEAEIMTLSDTDTRPLLSLIDLAHPFDPGGVPGAMANAELVLEVAGADDLAQRRLILYNYSVAQDADFPNTFYRVNPAMRVMLG